MKTLILSDIHANLPALESVLQMEGSFDVCLFLGDLVDYGPFPKECIRFLKNEMDIGVRGNHDQALAFEVDCGCRGDFQQFSEETRAWHRTLLGRSEIQFLKHLQPLQRVHIEGRSVYLAHASPRGDLFRYLQEEEVDEEIVGFTDEIILLGHTHIQFRRHVGHTLVVNPGSVGLARDGGDACYAVMQDGDITLHRIPYDVERTIRALNAGPISNESKQGLTKVLRGEWKSQQ